MPTVPMVRQKEYAGPQIPTVMSPDAAPLTRGVMALGRGIADAGRAVADVAEAGRRVKERKAQEEVHSMLADWQAREIGVWEGAPGEEGAEPVRGVRDWDEGDGSATEAMKAAWSEWRDNPEGLYAKASPEARSRADRLLQADNARMFALAARKDAAVAEARRQAAAAAALAASERAAMMHAYNDELFMAAATDAADMAARVKVGRLIANPEESDPGKLRFKTGDGAALYAAARSEAFDKLRFERARSLAEGADTAESEPVAAARMAMAAAEAETLPPALKPAALNLVDTARARRLDGMLGHARAEQDLDKQERLVAIAERAAKDYGAGGKLLGAVAEDAGRIRAAAQRAENHLALAALAEGREYEPGGNPRKEEALKWAGPKHAAAVERQRAATLAGKAEFVGAMIGAGAWVGADGSLRAVSSDEQRELLRSQLAAGNMRIPDYLAQKARLDKIEASGMKERHERVSAEVCAALGAEIKTLWSGAETVLEAKEDPARKIAQYTVAETRRELVPETETVTAYRGVSLFGIPQTQTRQTGRMVEKETTVRRKRELLAVDVAKAIDLLVYADEAHGLMADLDGNPATPAERLDARAYKAKLIADIKARQLAVDLDTQARAIHGALSARRRDAAILEARAITRAAGLKLPPGGATDEDTEEEDAD